MNNDSICSEWNGYILRALFNSGTFWIKDCQHDLNSIDIYPVPSGTTGRGIYLTLRSGCDDMNQLDNPSSSVIASAFARGTLLGARTHHGVVFSQWFRGFARGIYGVNNMNNVSLANAFSEAAETTHRSMVRPIQGEMWCVAKDIAKEASHLASEGANLCVMLHKSTEQARESVLRTSQLIPILKETGLVHSDSLALFIFLNGMCHLLGDEYGVDNLEIQSDN